MTDIVERLHDYKQDCGYSSHLNPDGPEAADEIIRLRDALKIARERITEWCDAVAVEWGQGSQTHNVARDGRDIVLAALRQPDTLRGFYRKQHFAALKARGQHD